MHQGVTQQCRRCSVTLSDGNAYLNRKKGTFQTACKACGKVIATEWRESNKDKELARRRDYYVANKERIAETTEAARVKRKYGLAQIELERMRSEQSDACAICKVSAKLVIDHCHATGNVRGLLCNACNTALGMVNDDTNILKSCIEYLEKHNAHSSHE